MEDLLSRLNRLPPLLPAVGLTCAVASLTACTPACEAVDSLPWGSCFAALHGNDAASIVSEIENPPDAAYIEIVEQARPSVRTLMLDENLPGLSLAVSVAGEIVWAEGFGWADIERQQPVTPRTRFRIGGVAKTMTATGVGRLIERGELDIDLPVRQFVPRFPEKPWPISTRQLMGHIAGIRHHDRDEEMLYRSTSCTGPLDALDIYADDSLLFQPGTDFAYSSYGWMLVGAVVEAAAGEAFLQFMQREIFDPLGMSNTVADVPRRAETEAATTRFYWPFAARDTKTGIEYSNDPDNSCLLGADGLLSTASDVVTFGAAMLEGRLLEDATLAMLQTPLILDSGASTEHGLGWFVRRIPIGPSTEPTLVFGHDGLSAGGTTSFLIVPEYGIAIAVTANVSFARNLPLLATDIAGWFASGQTETFADGR